MTNWKRAERAVAKALGGQRTSKTGQGTNAPDVETESWSIEVKHRDQLPLWLTEALAQAVRNASEGQAAVGGAARERAATPGRPGAVAVGRFRAVVRRDAEQEGR